MTEVVAPQDLDPAQHEQRINTALSRIRDGASKGDAMIGSGIYPETWKEWQDRARKGEAPYVELVRRVDRAYAECRAGATSEIRAADPKLWLARIGKEPAVAGEPSWTDNDPGQSGGLAAAGSLDIVQIRATFIERVARIAAAGITAGSSSGDGSAGSYEAAVRLVDVGPSAAADSPEEVEGTTAATPRRPRVRRLADNDGPGLGQDADGSGDNPD